MSIAEDPYASYASEAPPAAARQARWTAAWLCGGLGACLGAGIALAVLPRIVRPHGRGWFGDNFEAYLLVGIIALGLPCAIIAALLPWHPWGDRARRRPAGVSFIGAGLGFASCLAGATGASHVWALVGRSPLVPPAYPLCGIALLALATPWILGLRMRPLGRGAALTNLLLLAAAACLSAGVWHDAILNAAAGGSLAGTHFWITIGGDPNAHDGSGAAPLHYAALSGNVPLASLLIEHGAAIQMRDFRGRTPLHFAAREGLPQMVQLLLSWDADPTAPDGDGKTPLRLAEERRHTGVAAMLQAPAGLPHGVASSGRTP